VLVHNGRYIGPGLMDVFMDTPIDAYEKFIEAHCIAPIILTRALLPGMLERGNAQLVTITSSSAWKVPPAPPGKGGWGHAYSVGKSSGHPLVGALHAEYADRGLRAFNVEPGFVATERNEIVVRDFGHDIVDGAPPAAIGAVVAWLLTSPDADALAGTTVDAQATCLDRGLFGAWR
jgi:NAD(P)-dependent dehydrogenase (short-subunit alcohol dehydrogenase family)